MIRAAPRVEKLTPYAAPLEGRRKLLRLDFNENVVGPSPKVLEALRALPSEAYATYPEYAGLNDAYARAVGIPAANVGSFNGADAAIRALFDAYGEPGETLVTTVPTFGYYRPCAEISGMQTAAVPYRDDFSFPLDDFRAALSGARLCLICNPNNPTGTLLEPSIILELARQAPDTLFAVDEIYEPFTGKTVLPDALELDNVVALRSLSKGAGLAALRLGFACGASEVLERLNRVTGPYDINMFAVVAARAALEDPEHIRSYVEEVAAARVLTQNALLEMKLRVVGDGGNYLLVWPRVDVEAVERELRRGGILIRSMAGKPLLDGAFRLSIGTRQHMQHFLKQFQATLTELASSQHETR